MFRIQGRRYPNWCWLMDGVASTASVVKTKLNPFIRLSQAQRVNTVLHKLDQQASRLTAALYSHEV